jgi:hypothetical protein
MRKPQRRKSRRSPQESAAKNVAEKFLSGVEEKITGRQPDVAATSFEELQERLAAFGDQESESWWTRPRLHTAIFERALRDEELAKHGWRSPDADARAEKIRQIAADLCWTKARMSEFTKAVSEYRREQRIEEYLHLRQRFPEVEIQVGRFAGIDPLFALERQFKSEGIDPQLVAAALDADEPAIDRLSLRLIELVVAREKLPKSGPRSIELRRAAISDSTVNYLVGTMLESMDWNDDSIRFPASLVVLIRHQLIGESPDLYKAFLAHEKQSNAAIFAAQLLKPGEKVSVRRLAKLVSVSRSTAARWLSDPTFVKSLEAWRREAESGFFAEALKRAEARRLKS